MNRQEFERIEIRPSKISATIRLLVLAPGAFYAPKMILAPETSVFAQSLMLPLKIQFIGAVCLLVFVVLLLNARKSFGVDADGLDPEGVLISRTFFRPRLIPWRDIAGFKQEQFLHLTYLKIYLRDPAAFLRETRNPLLRFGLRRSWSMYGTPALLQLSGRLRKRDRPLLLEIINDFNSSTFADPTTIPR